MENVACSATEWKRSLRASQQALEFNKSEEEKPPNAQKGLVRHRASRGCENKNLHLRLLPRLGDLVKM